MHADARLFARSLLAGVGLAGLLALAACSKPDESHVGWPGPRPSEDADDLSAKRVQPPPLDPDMWPCSQCHDNKDLVTDPKRRPMTVAHDNIVLRHDEKHRWCLDCHDAQNRDVLRLASGAPVPFERSYELCGQCHGDKYRDWRLGVHGRRSGSWDGAKEYLLCVNCHDSHAPRFKLKPPMKAYPPPVRPGSLR